ncbi:MAG: type II toxin-antitoxin system RelB/DinJ family antitoxin [Candidatus Marinimicrobia bacterium]|jgi:DNA-damage-inducible protein J|nr:type II toxin-antitoxin system RelB/DinJ family antitoxin [Candidatus Neomarinimicrobiota bacterium]|tara:strand:+ start:345 stop:611 length:267 start_codon:yes stop_codon:yes gene_type:complete
MRSAHINIRTEPEIKKKAQSILKQLGMTTSEAINIFLYKVIMTGGLPFEVRIPNEDTIAAMKEIDNNENLKIYENADDLFQQTGIADK